MLRSVLVQMQTCKYCERKYSWRVLELMAGHTMTTCACAHGPTLTMQQHEATHLQSKLSGWEIMNIVIHSLSHFEEFAGLVISRHRCSSNIYDVHLFVYLYCILIIVISCNVVDVSLADGGVIAKADRGLIKAAIKNRANVE